jgi:hypothetical protein
LASEIKNSANSESRKQKAEGRRQKAESRKQKAESRKQKAELKTAQLSRLLVLAIPAHNS